MGRRQYPLIIRQGDTLTKPFRRRYASGASVGEVIDFPDHGITEGRLQVRTNTLSGGGALLMDLTTDNGGIVLGLYEDGTGAWWSGYLYAPAEDTALVEPWGDGFYDLKLWTPDLLWRKTIFSGPALLYPTITDTEA